MAIPKIFKPLILIYLIQAASRMYFNSQFFNHSGMGGVMGGHTVSININIFTRINIII